MKSISSATTVATSVNYVQRISTAGFELVADELVHAGGQNAGPAPYDYLLASLGLVPPLPFACMLLKRDGIWGHCVLP